MNGLSKPNYIAFKPIVMTTVETYFLALMDFGNCSGVLDLVYALYAKQLPKIEFDDLKRLEKIVSDKPLLAHQIVKALIANNVPAFYKLIQDILIKN